MSEERGKLLKEWNDMDLALLHFDSFDELYRHLHNAAKRHGDRRRIEGYRDIDGLDPDRKTDYSESSRLHQEFWRRAKTIKKNEK